MKGGRCATIQERLRRVDGTVAASTSFIIARKYQCGFQEFPMVLLNLQTIPESPTTSEEGVTACSSSVEGGLYFMATLFSMRTSRHIISIPS